MRFVLHSFTVCRKADRDWTEHVTEDAPSEERGRSWKCHPGAADQTDPVPATDGGVREEESRATEEATNGMRLFTGALSVVVVVGGGGGGGLRNGSPPPPPIHKIIICVYTPQEAFKFYITHNACWWKNAGECHYKMSFNASRCSSLD